jgi:hypothetical protein
MSARCHAAICQSVSPLRTTCSGPAGGVTSGVGVAIGREGSGSPASGSRAGLVDRGVDVRGVAGSVAFGSRNGLKASGGIGLGIETGLALIVSTTPDSAATATTASAAIRKRWRGRAPFRG